MRLTFWIASKRNAKAALRLKAEKNWRSHWHTQLSERSGSQKTVWVHCASLGEFDSVIPVLEQLKASSNWELFIAVSFFSPSGYEKRKNHPLCDASGYLPFDTGANATYFVKMLNPDMAVFVKYEFWLHFFSQIHKKSIPLLITGVRFSRKNYYFGILRTFYKKMFDKVSFFLVQDELSKQKLEENGYVNTTLVGDSRVDRCMQIRENPKEYPQVTQIIRDRKVFIIGSSWPEDEKIWLPFWKKNKENSFLIVAPHEISPERLNTLSAQLGSNFIRLSTFLKDEQPKSSCDGTLVDTIGDLPHLYQLADIAYIGGAFGKGLHNIMEALAFQVPVIFGPKIEKFPEARDAIDKGFGKIVNNTFELEQAYDYYQSNNQSESIKKYMASNQGASNRIVEVILNHLS
jgi:3-deoxy-D-manno-octulosonic-acid transferase